MPEKRPSFIITGPTKGGISTLCWEVLQYLQSSDIAGGGVTTLQNSVRWFYLVQSDKKISFEGNKQENYLPVGKFRIKMQEYARNFGLDTSSML